MRAQRLKKTGLLNRRERHVLELYNLFHGDCASGTARWPVVRSASGIKYILEEGNRLVIAFFKHDGIFHARLSDREVCAKIREAYQKNEVVSFIFDAELRILSVP